MTAERLTVDISIPIDYDNNRPLAYRFDRRLTGDEKAAMASLARPVSLVTG